MGGQNVLLKDFFLHELRKAAEIRHLCFISFDRIAATPQEA
jgi:hypothetical protein